MTQEMRYLIQLASGYDEELTDEQVERGNKLCSRFCTQEYYGEDYQWMPILMIGVSYKSNLLL